MRFEFATAHRILFGAGTLNELGGIGRSFGERALVVTGRAVGRADRACGILQAAGVRATLFAVEHEPTTADVIAGVERARAAGCELVIGYGGGSALDAAKAIAAMITNPGPLERHLEVIGEGRPLAATPAPCLAVPTTAGTGSEVTRNAVLLSPRHRVKVSLRSPLMLPRVALVDPETTYDLPAAITAATGMDALTQLIEPYVSARANPMTDGWCVEGIRRVARALPRAVAEPRDAEARADMALASLFGGLALANAGLGAVHGIAGPLGGMFPAPHGAVCAALLPGVIAANLAALRARAPRHPSLGRYGEIARFVTGRPTADADDLVTFTSDLVRELRIPWLSSYGVSESDVAAIVNAAVKASSMKANPISLTADELAGVVSGALGG